MTISITLSHIFLVIVTNSVLIIGSATIFNDAIEFGNLFRSNAKERFRSEKHFIDSIQSVKERLSDTANELHHSKQSFILKFQDSCNGLCHQSVQNYLIASSLAFTGTSASTINGVPDEYKLLTPQYAVVHVRPSHLDELLNRHKDIVISYAPLTPEMKVDEVVYNVCNSRSSLPLFESSFSKTEADVKETGKEMEAATISLRVDFLPMAESELTQMKRLLRLLQRTDRTDYLTLNQDSPHPLTVEQALTVMATPVSAALHTEELNNSYNNNINDNSNNKLEKQQQQPNLYMNFNYDESDMVVNRGFTMVLQLHSSSYTSSPTDASGSSVISEVLTARHSDCAALTGEWARRFSRLSAVQWVTHQHAVYALNRWAKGVCQTGE